MKKLVIAVLIGMPLVALPSFAGIGLNSMEHSDTLTHRSGQQIATKVVAPAMAKGWKWGKHGDHHSVPEIDAASATIAVALMGGFVAIVRERRRRRAQ